MDSRVAADGAKSTIVLQVFPQAPVAEPVAAVGRATCLLKDLRADRAKKLRERLLLEHSGPRWSSVLNNEYACTERQHDSRSGGLGVG